MTSDAATRRDLTPDLAAMDGGGQERVIPGAAPANPSPASPSPAEGRSRLAFRSRAAIYLGLGTVQRAMALILAPLYAHSLSPADFGLLNFLLALEALFGTIMDLGLSSGVVRSYFLLDRRRGNAFLAYAQFASLIASGLTVVALGGGVVLYGLVTAQPKAVMIALGLVLVSSLGQRINGLAAALYRAQEDAQSFALQSIIRIVAIPLISLGVAAALHLSLVAILSIRIAVFGATAAFELRQAWQRRSPILPRAEAREMLAASLRSYALPLLPHNLMRWGRVQGLRVLLGGALSMTLLALYSVASLPLQMLSLTGTASDQLFEPFYYRERTLGTPAALERLKAAATLVLGGQAALAIAAMAVVPDVFRLFFPAAYLQAALYAPLLLAGQYFTMIQAIWFKPLVFHKRTSALPMVTGISTAVGAAATFVLAWRFGLLGATLGYVATTSIGSLLACRIVARGDPDPTMPTRAALLLCGIVGVAGALPLVVGSHGWWLSLGSLWLRAPLHAAAMLLVVAPVFLRHRTLVLGLARGQKTRID